jgi:hypothetical protein
MRDQLLIFFVVLTLTNFIDARGSRNRKKTEEKVDDNKRNGKICKNQEINFFRFFKISVDRQSEHFF